MTRDCQRTWSETENVVWTADLDGLGWSSPVVWDDHIFVTTSVSAGEERPPVRGLYDPGTDSGATRSTSNHRWLVYDLDFETGAVRWVSEISSTVPAIERHLKNSFASETPVTDGERLYVYFGTTGLVAALDLTGRLLWTRELGVFNGRQRFGTAASPALHDGRLYVVNDNTTESFLVALDAATGDELWRTERGRGGELGDPVGLGKRPADRDRDRGGAGGSGRTPLGRAPALGAGRHDGQRRTDAVRARRASLHQLWIPRWDAATGVRHPSGRVRRHLAERWREWERFHRLVSADGRYLQHLGAGVRRSLLHAARPWLPSEPRCPHRTRGVYGRTRIRPGTGFTASPWAYNDRVFLLGEDGDTFVVRAGP